MKNQSTKTTKDRLWSGSFWAACGANICMFFAFYMIMPILPMYLATEFAADKSIAGIVLSSYIITALLFRPFAGYMVDSIPRKMLMILSYTAYIAMFGGYLLAGTLALFAIIRASHGLTFAMTTVSMNTVAVDIMPASRRGEGIGYFGVTTNIAMAIGPMAALMLFDEYGSYDLIFAVSLATGVLGLILTLLIKNQHKIIATQHKVMSLDRFILIKALPIAYTMSLLSFNYGAIISYVAVFTRSELNTTADSGLFFIFFAAGLVVSRILSGSLVNKGHFIQVALAGIILLIPSFVAFLIFPQAWVYYLVASSMGVGYGLITSSFQSMFLSLAHHNQRGTANATYFASWDLGIGIGILFGGIIASSYSYAASYLFGTGLLVIGLLLFIFYASGYYRRAIAAFKAESECSKN